MLSEALFRSWNIVLYSLMYSVYNDSVILWECFDRFKPLLFYYNLSSSDSSHTTSVYSTISVYHHYDYNHYNQLMNDLLKYQCRAPYSIGAVKSSFYFKFQSFSLFTLVVCLLLNRGPIWCCGLPMLTRVVRLIIFFVVVSDKTA